MHQGKALICLALYVSSPTLIGQVRIALAACAALRRAAQEDLELRDAAAG